MENIRDGLNRVARQYGVEIIDVRIKKADLPDGTPLQSAYNRMRTARQQEARSIRAEGAKRAQIIRAEADADAAQTYAAASARTRNSTISTGRCSRTRRRSWATARPSPAPTTIILSPQNDYLKEFSGRIGARGTVQFAFMRFDLASLRIRKFKSRSLE